MYSPYTPDDPTCRVSLHRRLGLDWHPACMFKGCLVVGLRPAFGQWPHHQAIERRREPWRIPVFTVASAAGSIMPKPKPRPRPRPKVKAHYTDTEGFPGITVFQDGTKLYWDEGRSSSVTYVVPGRTPVSYFQPPADLAPYWDEMVRDQE